MRGLWVKVRRLEALAHEFKKSQNLWIVKRSLVGTVVVTQAESRLEILRIWIYLKIKVALITA